MRPWPWILLVILIVAALERLVWISWQCTKCGKTNTTGPFAFVFWICDHEPYGG